MNSNKNKDPKSDQPSNNSPNQQQKDKDVIKAIRALRERTMRLAIAAMKEEKNSSSPPPKPRP